MKRRSAGACEWVSIALGLCVITPVVLRAQRVVVTDSSVRQGQFEAIATSRDTIVSSYPRAAREVRFRFSINGRENEFPPGTEHTIYLRPRAGRLLTPVYRFGVESAPPPPLPEPSLQDEDGVAAVTFRVDLRLVLRRLHERGRYLPAIGEPLDSGGVRHVYVVGDPAPLSWDYSTLRPGIAAELSDTDGDGIYEGTVPIATAYNRSRDADGRAVWARQLDLRTFPSLASSQRMQDALYRLSLEELRQLTRDDGTLSAGAKWPGVWTRDVALSTILSLAIVTPELARRSLLAKVDSSGRIIQDTGTGGSWPVSSDRMAWVVAAWEVYQVTGDTNWLRQSYDIARRSAAADLHAVRDGDSGLFNGESSFLDWREQSYPRWMQPADIYRSQNLGTNAVHYAAYRALAGMARALGERSAAYDTVADDVRAAMTAHLWQHDRGWYGQYRYGRVHLSLSPRAEGLGEALTAIYGAASPAQRLAMARHAPVMPFGTPTFWPFIEGERRYHNGTIWPFVTAFGGWAAAEAGSTSGVVRSLDAASRSTALFLTNKENIVASTGHDEGTALNSDRQLWSVAGTLAGTYRLLFGMRLEPARLVFRPMVPPSYDGIRTLRGLRYRGATLDVTVRGHGSAVTSVLRDGRGVDRADFPADAIGAHTLVITMNGQWPMAPADEVASREAPATPHVTLQGSALKWAPVRGATAYRVYRNGQLVRRTTRTRLAVVPTDGLSEYQVLAVSATGDESFLSEPVRVVPAGGEQTIAPSAGLEQQSTGYTGAGYLRLTREQHRAVQLPVQIAVAGAFAIDARYANGNGPVNTEDKVAVRTLLVDGDTAGVLVMPQRGSGQWADWGWSNALRLQLCPGAHLLALVFAPGDENMNGRENTALLDYLRLTRLARIAPGAVGSDHLRRPPQPCTR